MIEEPVRDDFILSSVSNVTNLPQRLSWVSTEKSLNQDKKQTVEMCFYVRPADGGPSLCGTIF